MLLFFNMRIKKIILAIFLEGVSFAYSQVSNCKIYYDNTNKAECHLLNKDYLKSDSCYLVAFKSFPKQGYNIDYLIAAINALKLNDTTKINSYLINFAKRGGDYKMLNNKFTNNIILENNASELLSYIKLEKNKLLKKTLKKQFDDYAVSVNWKLVAKINRMYWIDQNIARGFFPSLLPWHTQVKIMNKIDHKHAKQLLKICGGYGYWLGFDLLGEYRSYGKYRLEKIDMIIRHFNSEDLKLLEKYIINAINNLQYYPYPWASCKDWEQIKNPCYNNELDAYEETQIYGTMSERIKGVNTIVPFGKIKDVNIKLNQLHLNDIETYAKNRGWALPTEEKTIIKRNK